MERKFMFWAILTGAALCAVMPATLTAQEDQFGKNKVQYTKFYWSYIQTDHFDVYFADDGYPLAEFAANAAESAYVQIGKLFKYQLVNRVPIVVYNSHNAFQQSNVISEYMEEGIGGGHGMNELALRHLGHTCIAFKDVCGSGRKAKLCHGSPGRQPSGTACLN